MKQFVILSVCISMILRWCRMRKVLKDIEDVVSRLCHGSSTRVVVGELGLSLNLASKESSNNAYLV